ncbi:phospholipid-translocating P-type ATPase [Neoconidiobolus thromboides FSU 785]|nr:phospholipid-translocating P-type ATPase [Neoconidiobolus thromboides FSU 785]
MSKNSFSMKKLNFGKPGYEPLRNQSEEETGFQEEDTDFTPYKDKNEQIVEDYIESDISAQEIPLINELDETRQVIINCSDGSNKKYSPNLFRNQKYNPITFLPIVLYEQFKYFFNLYFLLVALSQFIPYTRIGYLVTYVGPLIFVLGVTISKEAYDDYQRYLRDKEANSQIFSKIIPHNSNFSTENSPSSKIKVGNLILLHKNQRVPADMLLLWTSDQSGSCFVRTDQLDGETDWKLRVAIPSCQSIGLEDMGTINGYAEVEKPHKDIYSFTGTIKQSNFNSIEPVNIENTLWANTILASGKAVGLVIYTGRDTRAALNTAHPKTKVGLLDIELNKIAKILCVVTFAISFLLIALNGFQGLWYIYLFRFLILFSSIIPISLRVNLDMGKAVYAHDIQTDKEIEGTIVRTSTIPEELGRIEYLLTDKTGTLTQNDMILKKIHLGTMAYSHETMDEVAAHLKTAYKSLNSSLTANDQNSGPSGKHKRGLSNVSIHGSSSGYYSNNNNNIATTAFKGRRDMTQRVKDLMEALALCHNVTPTQEEGTSVRNYQASSPDEIAIVKFTESCGLTLTDRDPQFITISASIGTDKEVLHDKKYEILHIFPFSSHTKRMGIVVKEVLSGDITFYLKGADAVMSPRVTDNQWLDEECANMAREGLRTLVIARKKLSMNTLEAFESELGKAKLSLSNRNKSVQEVVERHLENSLELLGVTGVEDKLQENVKNTLEMLRNAGIKIWMLTGDKIETATCIAISSKLVSRNQLIHQINKIKGPIDAQRDLELVAMKKDCCLVIDGDSISQYLNDPVLKEQFISLSVNLPAVVCCRCTPTQKAELTSLIKNYTGRRVCAIGDGGNDVSMILAADVGVGIVGKEGKQASLAADFSILQFSYLAKLLIWHGRNSYKRSSKLAQFVIHRGLIISVMQAVFSAIFYFAPIALYQGMLLVGYATLYTMGPVFSMVLDHDVNETIAMMYPELYKDLTKGRSLSYKTFLWWLIISIYQGGAIMLLALWLFDAEFINIVSISFTALILNELIVIAFNISTWHRYMIYSQIFSIIIYIASMFILKKDFDLNFICTFGFIWKVMAITAVSCFPLYVIKVLNRIFNPPSYTKLT